MNDVAKMAGVSVSTVSYSLTGSRPVGAATRARIEAAMAELGYTPNLLARGLRGRKSKILALLVPTRGRGVDLSALDYILGASDRAQEEGYHLLLWTTEMESLATLRTFVGQGLVDGFLVMEIALDDPRIPILTRANLPLAMIGRTERSFQIDWVDTDFTQCMRMALDHLASLGHRHVVLVNQASALLESGLGNAVRMRDSARDAAKERGIELLTVECESSAEAGRGLVADLSRSRPDVTAVLACNEQAVPGIITEARALGREVPEGLSVIAVAMSDSAALMCSPPLTTVSPAARRMGGAGVDILLRRIEGEDDLSVTQHLFPGVLTVRGSTGPAPDGAP